MMNSPPICAVKRSSFSIRSCREDRSLLDLIDADYTFLNDRLARHYGVPDITGGEMRRVQLADHNRGGVLGLGAVLTTTSYPLRTSPVLRGKWVLEAILGEKINPPPPNAGSLPPDDVQADHLTFRQRLERHRSQAECTSCHQRMDPLGFGLENFDPTGARARPKRVRRSIPRGSSRMAKNSAGRASCGRFFLSAAINFFGISRERCLDTPLAGALDDMMTV